MFWSIEAVALLALARRERDPQVALAAVVAYVLAIGQALLVVPPDVLAVGTAEPARTLIVGLAADRRAAGGPPGGPAATRAALGGRRRRRRGLDGAGRDGLAGRRRSRRHDRRADRRS